MDPLEVERQREAVWRGDLSPENLQRLARERQWPAEDLDDCRLVAALGEALRRMPPVPVSTNFTQAVLDAVVAAQKRPARRRWPWPAALSVWWPRLAGATALVLLLAMAIAHHRQVNERNRLAASLQNVAILATACGSGEKVNIEIWENFDVIMKMGELTADEELLTALRNP